MSTRMHIGNAAKLIGEIEDIVPGNVIFTKSMPLEAELMTVLERMPQLRRGNQVVQTSFVVELQDHQKKLLIMSHESQEMKLVDL